MSSEGAKILESANLTSDKSDSDEAEIAIAIPTNNEEGATSNESSNANNFDPSSSIVCKKFEKFIDFGGMMNFDANLFECVTEEELKHCAMLFVEMIVKDFDKTEFLGNVAEEHYSLMAAINKLIKRVIEVIKWEIEKIHEIKDENFDKCKYLKLGNLIGDLYLCDHDLIKEEFLIEFLELMLKHASNRHSFAVNVLLITLQAASVKFKHQNCSKFDEIMLKMENFDLSPNQFEIFERIRSITPQSSGYNAQKPLESRVTVNNFSNYIERLSYDKSAKYDNRDLIKNHFRFSVHTNILMEKIFKPEVDVFSYSRFLKLLFVTSRNSEYFVDSIAEILDDKITEIDPNKYSNKDAKNIKHYGLLASEFFRKKMISEEIFKKYFKKSTEMVKMSYDDNEVHTFCIIFHQCSLKLKLSDKDLYDSYMRQAIEFYNSKLISEKYRECIKVFFEIKGNKETDEIVSEAEEGAAGGSSGEPGPSTSNNAIPKSINTAVAESSIDWNQNEDEENEQLENGNTESEEREKNEQEEKVVKGASKKKEQRQSRKPAISDQVREIFIQNLTNLNGSNLKNFLDDFSTTLPCNKKAFEDYSLLIKDFWMENPDSRGFLKKLIVKLLHIKEAKPSWLYSIITKEVNNDFKAIIDGENTQVDYNFMRLVQFVNDFAPVVLSPASILADLIEKTERNKDRLPQLLYFCNEVRHLKHCLDNLKGSTKKAANTKVKLVKLLSAVLENNPSEKENIHKIFDMYQLRFQSPDPNNVVQENKVSKPKPRKTSESTNSTFKVPENLSPLEEFEFLLNNDKLELFDVLKIADVSYETRDSFAEKYLQFAIGNPSKIKKLSSLVFEHQKLSTCMKLFVDVVRSSCEEKMISLDSVFYGSNFSEQYINLGVFIAELYVLDEGIINKSTLDKWINQLIKYAEGNHTFAVDGLLHTLKHCARKYFHKEENFAKHLEVLTKLSLTEEQEKILLEIEAEKEKKQSDMYGNLIETSSTAKTYKSFKEFLIILNEEKDLKENFFDHKTLLEVSVHHSVRILMNRVVSCKTNVEVYATFVQQIFFKSFAYSGFIAAVRSEATKLIKKIPDEITWDVNISFEEINNTGVLLAELYSLNVENKVPLDLILEKLVKLNPVENHEILRIFLNILEKCFLGMKLRDHEAFSYFYKILTSYLSDDQIPVNMKDKMTAIFDKFDSECIEKTYGPTLKGIMFGSVLTELPSAAVKHLSNFAKAFFTCATFNPVLAKNFAINVTSLEGDDEVTNSVFKREIIDLCKIHFDAMTNDRENNVGIASFIVELYREDVINATTLQNFKESLKKFARTSPIAKESLDILSEVDDDEEEDSTISEEPLQNTSDFIMDFEALIDQNVNTSFDINKFRFINTAEYKYCAMLLVKKAISHPHKIKFLTNVAENIRSYINGVQLLIKDIGFICKREANRIPRDGEPRNCLKLRKIGMMMGALYVMDMDNTSIEDLKNWLEEFENLAIEGKLLAIGVIVRTLRHAHRLLAEKEPNFLQHYKDLVASLKIIHKDRLPEMFSRADNSDDDDVESSDEDSEDEAPSTVLYKSIYKYMEDLNTKSSIEFDYNLIKDFGFNERRRIAQKFVDELLYFEKKPAISPVIFFHRLWYLGERIKNFLYYVKVYLNEEMPGEISMENEDDEELQVDEEFDWKRVTALGRFHGELYSCSVITNAWLEIWLKNIFNLVKSGNQGALSSIIDVLNSSLVGIQIRDQQIYQSSLESLSAIEEMSSENSDKLQKLFDKFDKVEIPFSIIKTIRTIKFGGTFISLSEIEDVQLFTKIFFQNALMTKMMMKKFLHIVDIFNNRHASEPDYVKTREFRKCLINSCQRGFERHHQSSVGDVNEDEAVATIELIGELFLLGNLTYKIIMSIIEVLKDAAKRVPISWTCLSALIDTIGDRIIHDNFDNSLVQEVKKIWELRNENINIDEKPHGIEVEMSNLSQLNQFQQILNQLSLSNFSTAIPTISKIMSLYFKECQDMMITTSLRHPEKAEIIFNAFNDTFNSRLIDKYVFEYFTKLQQSYITGGVDVDKGLKNASIFADILSSKFIFNSWSNAAKRKKGERNLKLPYLLKLIDETAKYLKVSHLTRKLKTSVDFLIGTLQVELEIEDSSEIKAKIEKGLNFLREFREKCEQGRNEDEGAQNLVVSTERKESPQKQTYFALERAPPPPENDIEALNYCLITLNNTDNTGEAFGNFSKYLKYDKASAQIYIPILLQYAIDIPSASKKVLKIFTLYGKQKSFAETVYRNCIRGAIEKIALKFINGNKENLSEASNLMNLVYVYHEYLTTHTNFFIHIYSVLKNRITSRSSVILLTFLIEHMDGVVFTKCTSFELLKLVDFALTLFEKEINGNYPDAVKEKMGTCVEILNDKYSDVKNKIPKQQEKSKKSSENVEKSKQSAKLPEVQPKTVKTADNSAELSAILNNIHNLNIDQVFNFIKTKITDKTSLQNFTEIYLQVALQSNQLCAFAILAEEIAGKLNNFAKILNENMIGEFYGQILEKNGEKLETVLIFIAELFKCGIFEYGNLIEVMNHLSNNLHLPQNLQLYHIILSIVSGKLVQMKKGGELKAHFDILKGRKGGFKIAVEFTTCKAVMKELEAILRVVEDKPHPSSQPVPKKPPSNKKYKFNIEPSKVVEIFNDNFKNSLKKIPEILQKESASDIEKIAAALIENAIENYGKTQNLINLIENLNESTSKIFIETFQKFTFNYFSTEISDSNYLQTYHLIKIFCSLYEQNSISNGFVTEILEKILNMSCDLAADCVFDIMCSIGGKIERENEEKFGKYLKYFEAFTAMTGESCYRAKIYGNILRINDESLESCCGDLNTIESIIDDKRKIPGIIYDLSGNDAKIEKFLVDTWRLLIEKPEKIGKICESVLEISSSLLNFKKVFLKFLETRRNFFMKNSDDPESSKILSISIDFLLKLFTINFIDDSTFWIHPKLIAQLSHEQKVEIHTKILSRADSSDNQRFKVFAICLEQIVIEEQKATREKIKNDLKLLKQEKN